MIIGSVMAMREKNLKRMIAYSSVAQIGYIYAGIGVGTWAALAAALFHMLVHAVTKPLLFSSAGGLIEASGHSKLIANMKGAGRRNKWAGAGFLVGTLSMIGVPLFGGFISKVYLAINAGGRSAVFLVALALSSCLNAMYYMPVTLRIFSKPKPQEDVYASEKGAAPSYALIISCFSAINIALGVVGMLLYNVLIKGVEIL